jgi:murein DD-endopeptidase MepM/ murein hydrolase activator NlpD
MLQYRRLWTVALAIALGELTLLLGLVAAVAIANGGLAITIGPRGPTGRAGMMIPVAGVRRRDLRDSFGAGRSGGRRHAGIDIFAAVGTPVLAPSDAVVVERRSGGLGGTALYLRDTDAVTVYYFAHLSGYRAGLREGQLVRRGEVVGYVGRTGNVDGSSHLHFGVFTVTDPNQWYRGHDLNPYRLLTSD